MTIQLLPPGLAHVKTCDYCDGRGRDLTGVKCIDCGGTGNVLWRACPACGDIAWDRLPDGTYACRVSCGARWTKDHPGWRIQHL